MAHNTVTKNTEQRDSARRILVVSLDNVGDLVFATSLLRPLRERFPQAHIALWCKEYTAGLAQLMPEIDQVFVSDPFWDRSPGREKGSPMKFFAALRDVRRERFDTAILSHGPSRTAAAIVAAGIPLRIGLERGHNARWLTRALPQADRSKSVLIEMSRLLAELGIASAEPRYRLDVSAFQNEKEAICRTLGGVPHVALHPFASKTDRCVALDVWAAVADALEGGGYAPLWIGSTVELDRVRSEAASGDSADWRTPGREGGGQTPSERKRHRGNWVYADKLTGGSLLKVALAISETTLFIGHDSGPLHIAAALGVPTLGIFAPGEPSRTFPQGPGEWRMIARRSPSEITADDIVTETIRLAVQAGQ